MISRDARLRLIGLLLVPGLIGHTIQLLGEDTPWRDHAYWRYFNTPGWHLYLSPWIPVAIAVLLGCAVIALAVLRSRRALIAVIVLYLAHYLTYPYRIRNHMSHVFFELTMLGGVWLIAWALGAPARDPRVDRRAVTGMALVLCTTYFWAGLHKMNDHFLSLGDASSAVEGVTSFWRHGELGDHPPDAVLFVATYGTVIVECLFPFLAWSLPRVRIFFVIGLMLFHFPQVAVMDVADYPMLASAFYPALFSAAHFRLLARHLYRVQAWSLVGSAVGIAAQIWFMPWWGGLTIFGILVTALWGWAAGAMLRMATTRWRDRSRPRAAPAAAARPRGRAGG